MVFVCHRHILAPAVLLLLCCIPRGVNANAITTAASPPPAINTAPATCEFRTINYITASLPQQCLRSAWSSANSTATKSDRTDDAVTTSLSNDGVMTTSPGTIDQDPELDTGSDTQKHENSVSNDLTSSTSMPVPSSTEINLSPSTDADPGELNEAAFLSFEEWKKQTLEMAGQANENIGNKKSGPEMKKRDSESIHGNFDSLGEEGEIDLDFSAFRRGDRSEEAAQASQTDEPENQQDSQAQEGPRKRKDRSNEAGKTYKERFSYASFDGGATILKTHPGAKNAKAVLVENKDSYMLSECAAENKFLIIELSVCMPSCYITTRFLTPHLGRYMDRYPSPGKLRVLFQYDTNFPGQCQRPLSRKNGEMERPWDIRSPQLERNPSLPNREPTNLGTLHKN
jgi:hypothetical protein